jgi:hypothetical protein
MLRWTVMTAVVRAGVQTELYSNVGLLLVLHTSSAHVAICSVSEQSAVCMTAVELTV